MTCISANRLCTWPQGDQAVRLAAPGGHHLLGVLVQQVRRSGLYPVLSCSWFDCCFVSVDCSGMVAHAAAHIDGGDSTADELTNVWFCAIKAYLNLSRNIPSSSLRRGTYLAIGTNKGDVQIWDPTKLRPIRTMHGHQARVGCMDWGSHLLSTGAAGWTQRRSSLV